MTDLSPAALAVWATYLDYSEMDETPADLPALAAALRAAADQVVPECKITPEGAKLWWTFQSEPAFSIRTKFLAIAAELEAYAND